MQRMRFQKKWMAVGLCLMLWLSACQGFVFAGPLQGFSSAGLTGSSEAETIVPVSTPAELDAALMAAAAGTTIVLADGLYSKNGTFDLSAKNGTETSPITIKAANTGRAIITGGASLTVSKASSYVIIQGLRFTNTGKTALKLDSSNNLRVTECSFELIENGATITWLQIRGANSNYVKVDHNVFANKSNPGQVIGVDGDGSKNMSQYITIENNYFKNVGPRIDNGMETIRLGLSGVSMLYSNSLIQYNLFEECDGDPEVVSIKSSGNTVRYNTFRNSQGQLTLRHGNDSRIYGNYFFGDGVKAGVGGIRIYGNDHKIYNNYFEKLTTAPLLIDNGDFDGGPDASQYAQHSKNFAAHWRIYRTQVTFNTIVDSNSGITIGHAPGSKYVHLPVDTEVANNLVRNSTSTLYNDISPGNTLFQGNMGFGSILSSTVRPEEEIRSADPLLVPVDGLLKLSAGSPAINAALGNYEYVTEDLDGQSRSLPDAGADEYSDEPVKRHPAEPLVAPILLDGISLQIEAEDYSLKQGDVTKKACPECSGKAFMQAGTVTSDTYSLMYRLDVASPGSFYVHALASGTAATEGLLVSVDNGPDFPISTPSDGWAWTSSSLPFSLSEGSHDLVLKLRQDGIKLDKIALSKSKTPPVEALMPKADAIRVNGILLVDFSPTRYSYTVKLPVGTWRVPVVSATSSHLIQVTQTKVTFGKASVRVTDQNDPYLYTDYEVSFTGLPTSGTVPDRLLNYPIVGEDSSNGHKDPYVPKNAYDGNMSTRYAASGEQWISFDIGQVKPVRYILISTYNGDKSRYSFDLEVSTDNTVWKSVYSGFTSGTTSNLEMLEIEPVQARYIKYKGHGNFKNDGNVPDPWNNIVEFIIAGQSPIETLELIVPTNLTIGQKVGSVLNAVYEDGSKSPLAQNAGFMSSNPEVASVDSSGMIQAIQTGSTVITATYGLFQTSQLVTVAPAMTGLEFTAPAMLTVGETASTVVQAVYDDGSKILLTQGVSFGSSVASVAAINANGILTAIGAGSSVISATYGSYKKEFELTVVKTISGIELSGLTSVKRNVSQQAVVTALYSDSTRSEVKQGVRFSSDNQSVAIVDEYGVVHSLSPGKATITVSYEGFTAAYALTVLADDPSSPGYVYPGPGSRPDRLEIGSTEMEKLIAAGKLSVELRPGVTELVLPGNAAELLKDKPIEVNVKGAVITIPSNVLKALLELLPENKRANAKLSFGVSPVLQDTKKALLTKAEQQSGTVLRAVGEVYDFSLFVTDQDGKKLTLPAFPQPITLTFPVDASANVKLAGVYLLGESGELNYVGGSIVGGKLSAPVSHFSKYAALEYDKTFTDLPKDHWASQVVRELAAKHVIDGVSSVSFAPEREVTRAEFAALLVRWLGLKNSQVAPFTDVRADAWYAKEVGAAAAAGIVQGYTETTFKPEAQVTRQEMAAMIVRAYEYKTGKKAPLSAAASFQDLKESPEWAKTAVEQGLSLQLLSGRADRMFVPNGTTTRAESAQALYNLMIKTEK